PFGIRGPWRARPARGAPTCWPSAARGLLRGCPRAAWRPHAITFVAPGIWRRASGSGASSAPGSRPARRESARRGVQRSPGRTGGRARPHVPRIAGERRAQRTLALLEVAAEEPVNAGRLPLNNAPGAVERFGLARHASVPRSEELGRHFLAQGEQRAQHVSVLLREV